MRIDPCDLLLLARHLNAADADALGAEILKRTSIAFDRGTIDALHAAAKGGDREMRALIGNLNREKASLVAEMAKRREHGLLEGLTAFRKANLLSGPSTPIRNVADNILTKMEQELESYPTALVDAAVGMLSKQRGIKPAMPGWVWAAEKKVYSKETLQKIAEVYRSGGTTEELARMFDKLEVPHTLNTKSKLLNWYSNNVFRTQGAADVFARQYWSARYLREFAYLEAHNQGLRGEALKNEVARLVADPPDHIVHQVVADTETSLWANSNAFTRWLGSAQRDKQFAGKALNFAIQNLVPFAKVRTNQIGRALEYTPLGGFYQIAKSVAEMRAGEFTPEAQRLFSRAITRMTTGMVAAVPLAKGGLSLVGLIGMGYDLAKQGRMTPFAYTNPETYARDKAEGAIPGSLRIGDTWYVSQGDPWSTLLGYGAMVHEYEKTQKVGTAVGNAGFKLIAESPAAQGFGQIAEAGSDQTGNLLQKQIDQMITSLIPVGSLASNIAAALDPNERDAKTLTDQVFKRIPGLRTTLPEKRDALGRTQQQANPLVPFTPTKFSGNRVTAELRRLEYNLSKPTRKRGTKAHPEKETDEELEKRILATGPLVMKALDKLFALPAYQKLDDERKAEQVKRIVSFAREAGATKTKGGRL